jgi:hypothetical protein
MSGFFEVVVGVVYASAFEWATHKYVLHGLGRNKKSYWSFHWHEHHSKARRNNMLDDQYHGSLINSIARMERTAKVKEAIGLIGGALAHLPLIAVAPFFVVTVWLSALNYYRVHRRAHLDEAWARKHLPWHVDHHMGKNQDANWCVTWPLMDWILRTRIKS